jgi:hypothetical protein
MIVAMGVLPSAAVFAAPHIYNPTVGDQELGRREKVIRIS